jgi:hypothetical protein
MRGFGGFVFATGFVSGAYVGAHMFAGDGAWQSFSDRNFKDHIESVDTSEVLKKLVALPIATWNWKSQTADFRHMGPMAQDFHAAFGLGSSDTHISTVDADGVALAAIQGLNAKIEEHAALWEKRIAEKDAKIEAQTSRIEALERQAAELGLLKRQIAELRAGLPRDVAPEAFARQMALETPKNEHGSR